MTQWVVRWVREEAKERCTALEEARKAREEAEAEARRMQERLEQVVALAKEESQAVQDAKEAARCALRHPRRIHSPVECA